jgi:hypothetical protein
MNLTGKRSKRVAKVLFAKNNVADNNQLEICLNLR